MGPIYKALVSFFSKYLLILVLFAVLKILFFLFNYNYLEVESLYSIYGALRFDWMTIGILYLPLWVAHLIFYKGSSIILRILFHISNTIALFASILDFEYYKFTLKRTTADILNTKGLLEDVSNLIPQFLKDYWYLVILLIVFIILSNYLFKKVQNLEVPKLNWWQYAVYVLVLIAFTGIAFRGGLQYKPLGVIQAAKYSKGKNVAMVLNTPFTIIKTWNDEGLDLKTDYIDNEAKALFNPSIYFKKDSIINRSNIVILILEGFSKEYIGALSGKESYTPFLDSLIEFSATTSNTFANGKKSIEALPSILSGIPSLMNESYISSTYGGNDIKSIAISLKKHGYSSTFYHGGTNGTMGFDAFTSVAGFDNYIGLNEYPNEEDYDGNWGVFDEPFLKFVNNDLSSKREPFLASVFTLSSHHPYTIPDKYEGKFKKGELPIHESVGYADYALKKFFNRASKEEWFNNTIFVITADHTAQSKYIKYSNLVGIFEVPILFYHPKNKFQIENRRRIIQHSDIYPTLIDWLGIEDSLKVYGNSALDKSINSFSIQYINNIYQFIDGDYVIHSDGKEVISLFKYREDPFLVNDLLNRKAFLAKSMLEKLKAIIQQYNNNLIRNEMMFTP